MGAKLLALLVIAAAISQGHGIMQQITLPDETSTFITNDFIGKTITIPKMFYDTLEACYVIFPNGVMYEAYPEDHLPGSNVYFLYAAQPFTSCAIGFRGASVSMSGTYELYSQVRHLMDNSQSLTNQKFHITFVEAQYQ